MTSPVTATQRDGVIRLEGEISLANASMLLRESTAWFSAARTLQIDLSGISRSDSAGAALMLEWARRARKAGGDIRYLNVPGQIKGIMEFCALGPVVPA
jgi:phospholipid transport system transporter-binding protein